MKRLLLCAIVLGLGLPLARSQISVLRVVRTLADSGTDSLRQHVANSGFGDVIIFDQSLSGGTITLTSGQILVEDTIRIMGLGAANLTISGNTIGVGSRLFEIAPGNIVEIGDLTLRNGRVTGTNGTRVNVGETGTGTPGEDGRGGAILNRGALLLTGCVIRDNTARGGDGGYDSRGTRASGRGLGGAILNLGALVARACTFDNNRAVGGGGGGAYAFQGEDGGLARGGAIANEGSLSLLNCTLQNNTGQGGLGGFANAGANPNPDTLDVYGGRGGRAGGGAIWSGINYTSIVVGCTLNNNSVIAGQGGTAMNHSRNVAGEGGLAAGGGIESHTPMTLWNCTFYANSARGGASGTDSGVGEGNRGGDAEGGAIANYNVIEVTACTISTNSAVGGTGSAGEGDGDGSGGGLFQNWRSSEPGTGIIRSSIFAGNSVSPGSFNGFDVDGTITSLGQNIVSDSSGANWDFDNDFLDVNPRLAALADNGGWTFTMALATGSPAIGNGNNSLAAILVTDQRGAPRQNGTVDIGAYESGNCPVVNLNNSGQGSLRGVLAVARPGDTIVFGTNVSGTIFLGSELSVSGTRSIIGPTRVGVTVSGNSATRVFNIPSGANVTIENLTIGDGRVAAGTGANAFGAGVLNNGTLTLRNCTLRNNRVSGGNASGPFGSSGTGAGGGGANFGTMTVINCTLSGNTARGGDGAPLGLGLGGALANQGSLIIRSCTISQNSATGGNTQGAGQGGGIFQYNTGSTRLRNTIVANNGVFGPLRAGPDISGPYTDDGFNLIRNEGGPDPLLGPLQDNGGPTHTMALLTGSPAIDRGINDSLTTDQRGRARVVDFLAIPNAADACDIGAFELAIPTVDIGLRVFDGASTIRVACQPAGELTSPLRVRKGNTTYGVVLTDPNSPEASKLKINTASGIKAWAKLP